MYDTISLLKLSRLKQDLRRMPLIEGCQKHVHAMRKEIGRQFFADQQYLDIVTTRLVHGLAFDMDSIIIAIWKHLDLHLLSNVSLFAVGGYGRRELHPYSDVDVLVYIHEGKIGNQASDKIEYFFSVLWDIDLQASTSIRTSKDIKRSIREDITLASSILESRLLAGNKDAVTQLRTFVHLWKVEKFFLSKRKEQQLRHEKYNNISYQLEPDIKNSPGGLRDLQVVMWIAKHSFSGISIEHLVEEQLISNAGMRALVRSRNFLWSMRLGVHLLAQRSEERFLINYQRTLAQKLGYSSNRQRSAVEALMQRYYKAVLSISAANDSLMQQLEENILHRSKGRTRKVNADFYAVGDTLHCHDERCFERNSSNLLRCFAILGNNSRMQKLSAQCIHAIYENSFLIDDDFRADAVNKKLFIDILESSNQLANVLELMKRYNILGKYLPIFGDIIGKIQHDLFHIYTVDAHTILLIRNLENLLVQEQSKDLEIPAQVARQLPHFLLVVLAALFHDIAKGRGGDHSVLGAKDMRDFAQAHSFSAEQTELLVWLVEFHLRMSTFSQSRDLFDPQVIHEFRLFVDNKNRLDYLYVLTVADLMATNPSLWNSWKAALLTRLYLETREELERSHTPTLEKIIEDRKQRALAQLPANVQHDALIFWQLVNNDFFINKSASNMMWQTRRVVQYRRTKRSDVLVMIRPTHQLMSRGATEIAIYSATHSNTFLDIVSALGQLHVNIQEARIYSTADGFSFDSFIVLDQENKPLAKSVYAQVRHVLQTVFSQPGKRQPVQRYMPSRLNKFWISPQVDISGSNTEYNITIRCLDCPGLLASLVECFRDLQLDVVNARITTLGQEARDSFRVRAMSDISNKDVQQQLVTLLHNVTKAPKA